jgi:CubicO group peptidase (beta-lactamase class C family)
MKLKRLFCISLLFIQFAYGQTWQDTLSLIDKTLNQYHSENPGCQLSISRNGKLIFSKSWGMADLERNVPLTTNSILEAGSVSKQFTAASILLLEQQGKLSLSDDVRKYIPELPDYGTPIKLHHMIHHTSGLREWSSVAQLTGWPRTKKFYSNDDVLEIITRQKHLNNKPGETFIYSNSNYILLAIIVQRVSGLTLAQYTKKYIFEPAGMTHTQWRDNPNRLVPNRAIAYTKTGSDFETDMPNEYVYGAGGLLTTTEDLLNWNAFYQQGKFGSPSLLERQLQTEPLNNGSLNSYAAGLVINKVRGWDNISHNGATASYRAYLETFPKLNLSFAILSNTSQFRINNTANIIRSIFVTDKAEKMASLESSVNLPEAQLSKFSGMYKNERDGSTFQLSVKNGKMFLDGDLLLLTLAPGIFKSDNFQLNVNGSTGNYIPYSPRDTIPFVKVTPAKTPLPKISIYEGRYYSEEVNTIITIQRNKDTLMILFKAAQDYPLEPTYSDAFRINALDCDLEFLKGFKAKPLEIKMNLSGVRDIVFKKLK